MFRILRVFWLVSLLTTLPVSAFQAETLNGLTIDVPTDWTVAQRAISDDTHLRVFSKGVDVVAFYSKADQSLDMAATFAVGSKILEKDKIEAYAALNWTTLLAVKTTAQGTWYVKAFKVSHNGKLYYGYSRAQAQSDASFHASQFLSNIAAPLTRSLTGEGYTGKKYYLGWGAADSMDPSVMHNEVKYDVMHTHDIFTKSIGGDYVGSKYIGVSSATAKNIRAEWSRLKGLIHSDDMYVQYSSGHGMDGKLLIGLTYNEIRDYALSLPAKEVVIFIMACHSGGLVNSFNAKRPAWAGWLGQGRSLFVLASSKATENSMGGPGTDPGQPGGPAGSAGSAFGHALWKALIGESDGFVDGVKDGYISLGEIQKYTTWKTLKVGGHTPVATGTYHEDLIMNKTPSRSALLSLGGKGTEGLSDDEILDRIAELNRQADVRVERTE